MEGFFGAVRFGGSRITTTDGNTVSSSKSRERKDAVRLLRTRVGEIAAGRRSIPPCPAGLEHGPPRCRICLTWLRTTTNSTIVPARPTACVAAPAPPFRGIHRPGMHEPGHQPLHDRYAPGKGARRQPSTVKSPCCVLPSDLATTMIWLPEYRPSSSCRSTWFATSSLPAPSSTRCFHACRSICAMPCCLPSSPVGAEAKLLACSGPTCIVRARSSRLEPEQNKGRTVRVLALQGELAALIERRWHARKAGRTLARHVFHRAGHQLTDFRRPWLAACHQAGLGHSMFHSLRRSAARNMSLQGVPEKVIMSIMGHKTRVMFDRYNIVTEADQRAYMERLFGSQHGQ